MHGLGLPLLFAQDSGGGAAAAGVGIVMMLFWLALIVLVIAGIWKTLVKAGKPGWAAIVPIYNYMVLAEVGGKPSWWGLLLLVPCVGFVFGILICIEVAKKFGKGAGFGIGLAFLGMIFFPILGFGSATYNPNAT